MDLKMKIARSEADDKEYSLNKGTLVSERNRRQREKILKVAGRLFWQQGYHGTSVDDIAKAANLNKATLYYYFKDKDQMLYEIVVKANRELYSNALPIFNSDLPPEKKLAGLINNQIQWSTKNQGLAGIGFVERKNLTPKNRRSYTQMREEYEALFRTIVSEILAKQEPQIIDSNLATFLILGLISSIRQWYQPAEGLSGEDIAAIAVDFIFRGLACPSNFGQNNV
jgi:AcrR family transcriptional regulator